MPTIDRFYRGKRVLITGGLGFIGSNLVRALVRHGARVTIVDSLIPEYGGYRRVVVNISDVRDYHSLSIFVRGQDVLFNLAGQTSHLDSMTDPASDLDINGRAQLSILEACPEHKPGIRIVFASTLQIYGRPDYLPVDEKHPLLPVDVNGTVLRLTLHDRPAHACEGRAPDRHLDQVGDPREAVRSVGRGAAAGFHLSRRRWTRSCFRLRARRRSAGSSTSADRSASACGRWRRNWSPLTGWGASYRVTEFPADRKKIDIGDYYSDVSLIERAQLETARETSPRVAPHRRLLSAGAGTLCVRRL